jgi:hypothetical protein
MIALWVLCCLAAAFPASAQVQRMALFPGEYRIDGHGALRIESFCMDQKRDIPTQGDDYHYAVNGDKAVTVRIGDEEFGLQEAIDSGWIRIRGCSIREAVEDEEYLSELTPEERLPYDFVRMILRDPSSITLDVMLRLYENPLFERDMPEEFLTFMRRLRLLRVINPELYAEVAAMFNLTSSVWFGQLAVELQNAGDYHRICIENRSGKRVRITIDEATLLTSEDEGDGSGRLLELLEQFERERYGSGSELQERIWQDTKEL